MEFVKKDLQKRAGFWIQDNGRRACHGLLGWRSNDHMFACIPEEIAKIRSYDLTLGAMASKVVDPDKLLDKIQELFQERKFIRIVDLFLWVAEE